MVGFVIKVRISNTIVYCAKHTILSIKMFAN